VWPKVLLGGLAAAVVLCIGAVVVVSIFGNDPPPALDGYMDGKGIVYTTADRQMQVRLAEQPDVQQQSLPINGATLDQTNAVIMHKTYEMAVFELHGLPAGMTPVQVRASLRGGMTGMVVAADLESKGTEPAKFRGYEALRGSARDDEGASVETLLFYTPKGMYGLVAHTRHGTKDVLREMEESVVLFGEAS
jgi:hypothetical protein